MKFFWQTKKKTFSLQDFEAIFIFIFIFFAVVIFNSKRNRNFSMYHRQELRLANILVRTMQHHIHCHHHRHQHSLRMAGHHPIQAMMIHVRLYRMNLHQQFDMTAAVSAVAAAPKVTHSIHYRSHFIQRKKAQPKPFQVQQQSQQYLQWLAINR